MSPDAKSQNLLYISDAATYEVYVYSYPRGRLVGTLSGFDQPQGGCVDSAGDVWIANTQASELLEYSHGGTSPIQSLSVPGSPTGCSIDPKTGNLAVTDLFGPNGIQGNVPVYKGAEGTPTVYYNSSVYFPYFCAYDGNGNLYADGRTFGGEFGLVELLSRRSRLDTVTISGGRIYFPGGVQWDGKNVAVDDQEYSDKQGSAIYRLSISRKGATIKGTAVLTGSVDVVTFWKQGDKAIGADAQTAFVGFWKYPEGGYATKFLTAFVEPIGVAVSPSK